MFNLRQIYHNYDMRGLDSVYHLVSIINILININAVKG